MKIAIMISLFLAVIAATLVFDQVMSVDTLDTRLTRLVLVPGASNPNETPVDSSGPIMFSPTLNAETLRVQFSTTVFPGQNYLEFIVTNGGVSVWQKNQQDTFKGESRECLDTTSGLRCRVPLQRAEVGATSFALITALEDHTTIQQVNVVSIAQHQLIWPTNFSVVVLIFAFIPLALLVGILTRPSMRKGVILVMSVAFIALLSPSLLLFMLTFLTLSYIFLRTVVARGMGITLYVVMLLSSILAIKLVWPMTGVYFEVPVNFIILAIGFSYLVARQIDLALKIVTRQAHMPMFFEFVTYNLFWPSFAAGPITQITETQFGVRTPAAWADRATGLARMGLGLLKKTSADLVFAYIVIRQYPNIMVYEMDDPILLMTFFFGNMLFVYLDFSGYTDMVLGAARLMGVSLPENFNNPLMRPNMRAFWQNWHMSLTRWVNRTVFLPTSLILRREHYILGYALPVIATTMTIGVWHGFQFVWVMWGLHHAVGIFLTDLFLRSSRVLSARNEWIGNLALAVGRRLGFLFVWTWLMLSYCFTLSTSPGLSLRNYTKLLRAPIDLLLQSVQ